MFKTLQRVLSRTSAHRTQKYVPEVNKREYVLKTSGEHDLAVQVNAPDTEGSIKDVLLKEPTDKHATAVQLAEASAVPHKANKYRKALNKAFNKSGLVDLRQFLPEIAREYTNCTPEEGTPNCWNAILVWHDPSRKIEYTDEIELEEILKQDYIPITINDLRIGDVIAFRNSRGTLVHTAIYITKDLVWHKPGYTRTNPWTFATFNSTCRTYYKGNGYITFHRKKR